MIGRKLVTRLLARRYLRDASGTECEITEILVCDVARPDPALAEDPRLRVVTGAFGEPDLLREIATRETAVIFHLAAIVSGAAEADFDLGLRVNLHDSERLLEAAREAGTCPRIVFASSAAVYGGLLPEVVDDATALNPQTSYGSQKAMVEFLLNDYSRKGYIDGRALRLPTIAVRPGKPNKAASAFASSIIRDPLEGRNYSCPVAPETKACLLSPRRVVDCFVHATELPAVDFGTQRVVQLPGLTVTLGEVIDVLRSMAGDEVVQRIGWKLDPVVAEIVAGWPVRFAAKRAAAMGFEGDRTLEDIIRAFIEDDLENKEGLVSC